MIFDIILPKKIGSYYLLPEKTVAINIGKTHVYATVTLLKGKDRIILDLLEQPIELNNNTEYQERVINALRLLKIRLPKYSYLIASLSSTSVIFKEIIIPFLGEIKTKMVAPFEVETLLPFSLDQAYIDSIITKENKIEKSTELLVTAVKKDYLDEFVDIFEKAELKLDKITVDILDLYGLYEITNYKNKGNTALIDLNLNTTCLAIIIEGQLKYIRVLPKGIINAVKKISAELNIDANTTINKLINFGINDSYQEFSQDDQIVNSALSNLFEEFKFTIDSYKEKLKLNQEIKLTLLTGLASEIKGIKTIAENVINIETDILESSNIINKSIISSKIKAVQNIFLPSIASSIQPEITQNFNLYKKIQEINENKVILTQIIALFTLLFLTISTFSIYSYLRIRKLKNTIKTTENEAINELNKMFKLKKINTLDKLNKAANAELAKQETAWQQLSIKNRYSMLTYLSLLSKCIKTKDIGLNLKTLDIKNNKILIYGSVPGFEELKKLQNQINKCLLNPDKPQSIKNPNFTKDPIIIEIADIKELNLE